VKNTLKLIGIIAIVTVIGFGMAACANPAGSETDKTPLATPANLHIEADASGFFLKWNTVTGAASYLVDINGETFSTSTTSYSLDHLANDNRVHKIRVKAIAPSNSADVTDSAFSAQINCEPAIYVFMFEANSPLRITGLTGYGGTMLDIVIPEQIGNSEVTAIGHGAFENNATMVSVVIPATVTAVGNNAFSGATALTEVTFGSATPPSFGAGVFNGANSIETIVVPAGSESAFESSLPSLPPVTIAVMYNVTFNANGGQFQNGSETLTLQVRGGQRATQPQAPARQGFTFVNWTATAGGTSFDFNTIITWHTNLFARWNATGGGTTPPAAHEDFNLATILNALNPMPTQLTATTWGQAAQQLGHSNVPILIEVIKNHLFTQTGRTVVNIMQVGAAMPIEITAQTPISLGTSATHPPTMIRAFFEGSGTTPPQQPAHEDFDLTPILLSFGNDVNFPATTWGGLLIPGGRFSTLDGLIHAIIGYCTVEAGRLVVNIMQVGALMPIEITEQTPISLGITPTDPPQTRIRAYFQ